MTDEPRWLRIGTGPTQYALDSPLAQTAMAALDAVPVTDFYLNHYVRVPISQQRQAMFSRWRYGLVDEWQMDFLGTEEDCLAFWPMREHPNLVRLALATVAGLGQSREAEKARREAQKLLADEQAAKQMILEAE